jgi:hypothetical protein
VQLIRVACVRSEATSEPLEERARDDGQRDRASQTTDSNLAPAGVLPHDFDSSNVQPLRPPNSGRSVEIRTP